MTRMWMFAAAVGLMTVIACDSSSPVAPFVCSTASLQGAYGVQRSGLSAPGAHIAAVGLATFDGNGHLSVQETIAQNGTFVASTHTGTYSISSSCAGTENDSNGTPIADLDMIHAADELLGMSLAPGSNSSNHYMRVTGPCSAATLNGSYGFQRNGTNAAGAQLLSIGSITFDGVGGQVVRQTISRGGTFNTVDQVGMYAVNADCTGTQMDTTGIFSRIVVTGGGDVVLGISTTPGNSIVVHYERDGK